MLLVRRKTRQIRVGNVAVGGGVGSKEIAPVSVQTMAKVDTHEVEEVVSQLIEAKRAGCDIARVAVPDIRAAWSIPEIKERTGLPIVADIHFDYRLALEATRSKADALRVNPGNLGGKDALKAVVDAAGAAAIPIRVGVNGGSLPKTNEKPTTATAQVMVDCALEMVHEVQQLGFFDLKVSLKAFDITTTVEANRKFSVQSDLPLHLGVTEAGPLLPGAVRSATALGILLAEGIGETVRISLTAPPIEEVKAAIYLLRALGLRSGPVVVSCPTCGRTQAKLVPVAMRIESLLQSMQLDRMVAVMGCEVNGPGEAREADLGIAFGPSGKGLLFESGQILAAFPNDKLEEMLVARLMAYKEESQDDQ